jgi:hypothetical protein
MARAKKIADAYVEISARQQRLDADLNSARGKLSRFVTHHRGLFKEMFAGIGKGLLAGAGIAGGIAAFTSLEAAIHHVVGAALEAEASEIKLAATLRSTGNEVHDNVETFNHLADQLRDTASVDRETTRSLVALALNLGITADKAGTFVRAAIGLAEATGGDATSAMEALAKAANGSFRALEKQFPALKKLKTEEEKLDAVQVMAERGLAQRVAQLDGAKGSLDQLKLSTHELAESLGGHLMPAMTSTAQAASFYFKTITEGTFENNVTVAAGEQAILKYYRAWLMVFGLRDAGLGKAIKEIDDQIDKATQERIEADNRLAKIQKQTLSGMDQQNSKAKALKETLLSLSGATDIWRKAQEAVFATKGKKAGATTQAAAGDAVDPITGQAMPTTAAAGGGGSGNTISEAIAALRAGRENGRRGRIGETPAEEFNRLGDRIRQLEREHGTRDGNASAQAQQAIDAARARRKQLEPLIVGEGSVTAGNLRDANERDVRRTRDQNEQARRQAQREKDVMGTYIAQQLEAAGGSDSTGWAAAMVKRSKEFIFNRIENELENKTNQNNANSQRRTDARRDAAGPTIDAERSAAKEQEARAAADKQRLQDEKLNGILGKLDISIPKLIAALNREARFAK